MKPFSDIDELVDFIEGIGVDRCFGFMAEWVTGQYALSVYHGCIDPPMVFDVYQNWEVVN